MSDIKDNSYGFEAIKSVLRQSKDGIVISLVIHPSDVPSPLLSDPIGSERSGMGTSLGWMTKLRTIPSLDCLSTDLTASKP